LANQEMLLVACAETTLKSSPVRILLERKIAKHLRIMLSKHGEKPTITRKYGRIIATGIKDLPIGVALASKVFGVASVMRAIETSTEMNVIVDQAVAYGLKKIRPGTTFAVRARRVRTHQFTSKDLENAIGSKILEASVGKGIAVDLKKPETTINVEVKDDRSFIYSDRVEGPGGLPYGCQGSVVSLFSGSLSSRLSTWLFMKRGARVVPLYCDGESLDQDRSRQNALEWLRRIYSDLPVRKPTLIVVPFKDVLKRIEEAHQPDLQRILRIRAMLTAADVVAKEVNALGIVTGETLGSSILSIDEVASRSSGVKTPIHRPVIGFEGGDIQQLARKASLYDETNAREISALQRSTSRIALNLLSEHEASLGISSILERALAKREMVLISPQ